MGKGQRDKGQRGEREVAELISSWGFSAKRDGRLDSDLSHNIPGVHLEVKRAERLRIPEWIEQTEKEAQAHDQEPVLVFRQNNELWRAVVDFEYLLALIAGMHMLLRQQASQRLGQSGC